MVWEKNCIMYSISRMLKNPKCVTKYLASLYNCLNDEKLSHFSMLVTPVGASYSM